MIVKRSYLSLLTLCSLSLYAETPTEQPSLFTYYSDDASKKDEVGCTSQFRQSTVGVRTDQVRGIGYKRGYTTLESFTIFGEATGWMPCLDVRGHVFNDGKLAGNLGIGGRRYLSSVRHTLGTFLYYDVRQHRHFTMNQLSPGFEMVGDRMEYRLNAYFPVGKRHTASHHAEFSHFHGNRIMLKRHVYRALLGVDAEVGGHWTKGLTYDLYTALGPYYLTTRQHHGSGWGGMVRVQGRYKEIVSLQAKYSYDALFKSTIQGQVGLHYAFGKKLKGRQCNNKCDPVISRATFAPYRLEIPMGKRVHRHETAINPETHQPWQVWFVDNTSHSLGTYESPFSTLSAAANASDQNEIIYVFPGNQTTTGMNQGILLQDGQQLLGSGVSHLVATTRGFVTIPALTEGIYPTITAPGNVVVTGNGNTVSGMQIRVPNGLSGIIGPGGGFSPVYSAVVTRNKISGPGDQNAIFFARIAGHLVVQDNQMTSIPPVTINKYGIYVGCLPNQSLSVQISGNHIAGYDYGVNLFGANLAAYVGQITNNTMVSPKFLGISLTTQGANFDFTIHGNTIIDSDAASQGGISVVSSGNRGGIVSLSNNYLLVSTPTTSSGISVTQTTKGPTFVNLNHNEVVCTTPTAVEGISLSSSGGPMFAQMTNNRVILNNPGQGGLDLEATETGSITITLFKANDLPFVSSLGDVNIFETD